MQFDHVLAQDHLKKHLIHLASGGRLPHAQLFAGPEGSGTLPMALAFARHLLCGGWEEGSDRQHSCHIKCDQYTHPDLHFIFPNAGTKSTASKDARSAVFLKEWRKFLKEQPYGNLFDWLKELGIENKQGFIGVSDAEDLAKSLSLKSYEGGYKIAIIWMAEKMHTSCANKLLKLIEEPPQKTLIILTAEDPEAVLPTIRSRCQTLTFKPVPDAVIASELEGRGADPIRAKTLAHQSQGNVNKALDLLNRDSEDLLFENWFVTWVRTAFRAKQNKQAVVGLLKWSEELAKSGRETQKLFLSWSIEVFRQALLINYKSAELTYLDFSGVGFDLSKLAPFIHGGNILGIVKELEDAQYHIERNGNPKMIFTDLSIKLTRLLHQR